LESIVSNQQASDEDINVQRDRRKDVKLPKPGVIWVYHVLLHSLIKSCKAILLHFLIFFVILHNIGHVQRVLIVIASIKVILVFFSSFMVAAWLRIVVLSSRRLVDGLSQVLRLRSFGLFQFGQFAFNCILTGSSDFPTNLQPINGAH